MPDPNNPYITPEVVGRMLDAISEGRPTYRACRENGLRTLHWLKTVTADPDLAAAVSQAEKCGAQRMVEEALEIADTDPDPHRARVRMIGRHWIAGRVYREKYGDQNNLTVSIGVDLSGALMAARQRVLTAVKVESLPAPPAPGRAEYSDACDPGATQAEPAFPDPLEDQGDSIVTRPDRVSRELAEIIRQPVLLDDVLD